MIGSALGGVVRFWLMDVVTRRFGEHFPWGTLAVNASGSLLVGMLAAIPTGVAGPGLGWAAWHFAVIGFLGSYTTVSTFSLQTLALARAGAWAPVAANIMLSLGLCVVAAACGLAFARSLAGLVS